MFKHENDFWPLDESLCQFQKLNNIKTWEICLEFQHDNVEISPDALEEGFSLDNTLDI
jgi:hypothetical protein